MGSKRGGIQEMEVSATVANSHTPRKPKNTSRSIKHMQAKTRHLVYLTDASILYSISTQLWSGLMTINVD